MANNPGGQNSLPVLSQLEVDKAREAFNRFDEDHSGSIDIVSAHAPLPACVALCSITS
jgi:hypothetical protein